MKLLSPTPNGKRIDMIIHQALMRAGGQLWPVYYQLVCSIGTGEDGFTSGKLAEVLHMPRRTLRKYLGLLRYLGLVAPIQTNSRRGVERIGVRYRLDAATIKLLEELRDGVVKLDLKNGYVMRGTERVDHSEKLMAVARMICVKPEILSGAHDDFVDDNSSRAERAVG